MARAFHGEPLPTEAELARREGRVLRVLHSARNISDLTSSRSNHPRVDAIFRLADAIEKRVAAATVRVEKLTQAILAKACELIAAVRRRHLMSCMASRPAIP